jgi:hypothetical protein
MQGVHRSRRIATWDVNCSCHRRIAISKLIGPGLQHDHGRPRRSRHVLFAEPPGRISKNRGFPGRVYLEQRVVQIAIFAVHRCLRMGSFQIPGSSALNPRLDITDDLALKTTGGQGMGTHVLDRARMIHELQLTGEIVGRYSNR